MNIEKVFDAVRTEPDQPSLVIATIELENQGYEVTINSKYRGSKELEELDENGELELISQANGVEVTITKASETQVFRVQFLDLDIICFTTVNSPRVMYDPDRTVGFYRSGRTN